jgi:hypothetical protein
MRSFPYQKGILTFPNEADERQRNALLCDAMQ